MTIRPQVHTEGWEIRETAAAAGACGAEMCDALQQFLEVCTADVQAKGMAPHPAKKLLIDQQLAIMTSVVASLLCRFELDPFQCAGRFGFELVEKMEVTYDIMRADAESRRNGGPQ